jgi:hypothetical protein
MARGHLRTQAEFLHEDNDAFAVGAAETDALHV